MRKKHLNLLVHCIFLTNIFLAFGRRSSGRRREGKVFSLFNLVRFENDICQSSSLVNTTEGIRWRSGTCYTTNECSSKGGSAEGSCAAGFGVCCVFVQTSGDVSQNCTYITNEGYPSGFSGTDGTSFTVEKSQNNICTLRLDFDSFTIAGPTGSEEANGGSCDTDTFTITTNTGRTYPTICGQNSGEHIYVEIGGNSGDTAVLAFSFTGAANTNRAFSIKIAQLVCGAQYAPPTDCFQYFTSSSGTFQTFNFRDASTSHLANQNYVACIRKAAGMCCVQYQFCTDAPSELTLYREGIQNRLSRVDNQCTADFLVIHGATSQCSVPTTGVVRSRICGDILHVSNVDALQNIPVCDESNQVQSGDKQEESAVVDMEQVKIQEDHENSGTEAESSEGDLDDRDDDDDGEDDEEGKDITEGLMFNVLIGISIMLVILVIGTAMLYAVQKILISSSQHNAAHSRQQEQLQRNMMAADFATAGMDNMLLQKLKMRRIVHPKDLSAYLVNHEFNPSPERAKNETESS